MPKHGKRKDFSSYARSFPIAPIFPHPMMMNPPMMPPMMMPPMMPPPIFTRPVADVGREDNRTPSMKHSLTHLEPMEVRPSKEELACLPFFHDEIKATKDLEPTDIIIMDFDRTLLPTPVLNKDLLNKQARQISETKLEWGNTWWQNRDVLEAAITLGKWDRPLVEIARESSRQGNVLLVITTARTKECIPRIIEALQSQGISHIDHISCSESERFSSGSNSKEIMSELSLNNYDTLERIFVMDGNKLDANRYTKAAARFVHEGWLNSEAFYAVNKVLQPTQLSVIDERDLIQKVLMKSSAPVESHVIEQPCIYKITLESRKTLVSYLASTLFPEIEFEYFECQQAEIVPLPNDSAEYPQITQQTQRWIADSVISVDKQCRIQLHCFSSPDIKTTISAGKLKSYVGSHTYPLEEAGIIVDTYTYEVRRLDVMLNNTQK